VDPLDDQPLLDPGAAAAPRHEDLGHAAATERTEDLVAAESTRHRAEYRIDWKVRRVLVLSVVLAALRATPAAAAPEIGLVIFHGSAEPTEVARSARDRAEARARAAGRAWLDVTPAPPARSTAPDRLRAGIDAYEELRWDDALAALDAAADELARAGGGMPTGDLSDVFLYRGLVHTQRGDATRAWDDLVRAATLAPARTLDPLRFPTRAIEAFDRARDAVKALPRARLVIDAPAGCDVEIDGGLAAEAELPHGEHLVAATCPGSAPWGRQVVLAGELRITPELAALAPPTDDEVARLIANRGVEAALVIVVADLPAAITATLRVVDARGRGRLASTLALDGDAVALDAAIDDALVIDAPVVAPPPRRARWWRSPWLWAAVGAVATAAVVLPLTLGDDGSGDASVRPSGWSW
jgi:hypothetical protein